MAIVNVSLNTSTRQAVLTIDGILIPSTDLFVEKYIYDGEEHVRFGYTIENTNLNGMKERRQFYLPSPEEIATEAHNGLDDNGFASKIIYDDEKAKADTIEFLRQNHC